MIRTHLNDAIAACQQALETGTGFEAACQRLGNVLQGMGKFQDAAAWQTRSLQTQPDAATYAGLGKLYAGQQQWQQAIAVYEQARLLDPENANLYRHLASLYARVGQRRAEVEFRYRAVSLNPRWANSGNQLALGNALAEQGKILEAIACYQRAIQLNAASYEAHYNLGVVFAQQEQWQQAIAAFSQALTIKPDHVLSHYGLGKLATQQARLSEAVLHYRQAADLDPQAAEIHYALGETLLKLRQWQAAETVCHRAVELNSDFSWAYHNWGYALLKQRKWQDAAIALQRATELNPSAWTYYHLGTVWLRQQHWQPAIAAFLAAVQLQDELVGVYNYLGYGLRHQLQQGAEVMLICQQEILPDRRTVEFYGQVADRLVQAQQFDGAIAFYDLALLQAPTAMQALQQRRLQAVSGKQQIEQDIALHRQQIEQLPESGWLYTHLGNLLADQGEVEEAIALHQTASILKGWQSAAALSYQFTHDWFTHNIPVWMDCLKVYAHHPHVQAIEIGSFEGMSACWLLEHILTHPLSRLTCVDQYFQECFEANVAQTGAGDRLIQVTGDSHAILSQLAPATYDLVYIDGCHLAHHVQQDAILSWQLLKTGGILIFDDYEWTDANYPGQDTQIGINLFLDVVQDQVAIVHQGYQLILQKLKPIDVSQEFSLQRFALAG